MGLAAWLWDEAVSSLKVWVTSPGSEEVSSTQGPSGEGLAAEKQEQKFPSWLLATDPGSHQDRSRGAGDLWEVWEVWAHTNWGFCWCTGHSENPQGPPSPTPERAQGTPREVFMFPQSKTLLVWVSRDPTAPRGAPQHPPAPLPGSLGLP